MTDTNFEKSQGETWKVTISVDGSNNTPQQIASAAYVPSVYFSGLATKTGQTSVPIRFQYHPSETKEIGRGTNSYTESGVYALSAYIPADEVGSCSIDGHANRAACEAATGTWTVDTAASLLTTANMSVGDWRYEIRMADARNPSNLELSTTALQGTLTIVESVIAITDGASFEFGTPVAPIV